jgi:hypothetical protein
VPPEGPEHGEAALDAALRALDAGVASVWAALPANTLLVVATGHGDTAEVERLRVSALTCIV